jgi:hypothetical protein
MGNRTKKVGSHGLIETAENDFLDFLGKYVPVLTKPYAKRL